MDKGNIYYIQEIEKMIKDEYKRIYVNGEKQTNNIVYSSKYLRSYISKNDFRFYIRPENTRFVSVIINNEQEGIMIGSVLKNKSLANTMDLPDEKAIDEYSVEVMMVTNEKDNIETQMYERYKNTIQVSGNKDEQKVFEHIYNELKKIKLTRKIEQTINDKKDYELNI